MPTKKAVLSYLIPICCAGLQWCVTVASHINQAFFRYQNGTFYYQTVKYLFLLALIAVWCFVFHVARKLRQRDAQYFRGLQIFLVYFAILMGLLVILWPGTWSWDDAITLNVLCYYDTFFPWQHILTGIYQDVLLQFLPFPGGLILLQNGIIALCVAYCVTKLEVAFSLKHLSNPLLDILLKLLPFLLPPVLMYQFSGYRMGLYVYLDLTMLVMLLCAGKNDSPWSWGKVLLFSFLSVIVTVWRTEALVYIPGLVLLLALIRRDTLTWAKKGLCVLLIQCGFVGLNQWQSQELGDANYQIASLMRPCVELVRAADPTRDAQELSAIDSVVILEVIYSHPSENGENLYWFGDCVRDYPPEAYGDFLKAMVKLSLKYPKVVFLERWNLFLEGSGITGASVDNIETARFFDEDYTSGAKTVTIFKGWFAYEPIFKGARKQTIYWINGLTSGGQPTIAYRLIWNAIIPELILAFVWLRLLIQKKWYPWLLCSMVLAKLGIVFLTQPSRWLMYVLPFYLLGYAYLTFRPWIYYSGKKGKTNG